MCSYQIHHREKMNMSFISIFYPEKSINCHGPEAQILLFPSRLPPLNTLLPPILNRREVLFQGQLWNHPKDSGTVLGCYIWLIIGWDIGSQRPTFPIVQLDFRRRRRTCFPLREVKTFIFTHLIMGGGPQDYCSSLVWHRSVWSSFIIVAG